MSERISEGRKRTISEPCGAPSVGIPQKLEPIKNHQFVKEHALEKEGEEHG